MKEFLTQCCAWLFGCAEVEDVFDPVKERDVRRNCEAAIRRIEIKDNVYLPREEVFSHHQFAQYTISYRERIRNEPTRSSNSSQEL